MISVHQGLAGVGKRALLLAFKIKGITKKRHAKQLRLRIPQLSAGWETNASSTGVVHETAQWGGDESLPMSQINQSQPGLKFNRSSQSQ